MQGYNIKRVPQAAETYGTLSDPSS